MPSAAHPSATDALPADGRAGRILVVVLHYNGLADTLACLDSLARQTWPGFEVLVIDNGSATDDAGAIAAHPSGPEMLVLPRNLGWAGGNNVGMRLALERGYGFACLLNNDTILEPDALAELAAAAAALGRPCLLHPAIAYYDEPGRWQLRPDLDPAPPGNWPDPAWDVAEFPYAYGACLLLPEAVLRSVGLLDERFFLQLEEMDYYMRAKAQGLRSFCARRARILHKESVSFGGRVTPTKTYYSTRNTLLFAEKHMRAPAAFYRAARRQTWTLYHQAQEVGARPGWPGFLRWSMSSHPMARAAREGVGDYLRRRFGPRRTPAP